MNGLTGAEKSVAVCPVLTACRRADCRMGLEGADRVGLRLPSLSLFELLGGVGGRSSAWYEAATRREDFQYLEDLLQTGLRDQKYM